MRVKTSITFRRNPENRGSTGGEDSNRSRVIEQAVEVYAAARARNARDARDLEIINRRADALNREVADALAFQEEP